MVCDGMGGMDEGDRASRLAATQFAEDYAEHYRKNGEGKWEGLPEYLEEEAVKLDKMVHELTNLQGVRLNSGTTIVATIFEEDRLTWLSVGDSRIYLIRAIARRYDKDASLGTVIHLCQKFINNLRRVLMHETGPIRHNGIKLIKTHYDRSILRG